MMQLVKSELGKTAKELGFVRDTLEKVCRLTDVLGFFETDGLLGNCLALKGGTAINLTIFDLPRLSVDIDLDYCKSIDRDEMIEDRGIITEKIRKYMFANGYALSPKSKQYHALDSFVFEYINCGGVKDNIKIEINYMLRCHVLPIARRNVKLPWSVNNVSVLSLAPIEIFASKTVALLSRAAPRDLYDLNNMVRFGIIESGEEELFRKCVVFYSAISTARPPENFNLNSIEGITWAQIKRELYPVLRTGDSFVLEDAYKEVRTYLGDILTANEKELVFWENFRKGKYMPELVFADTAETLAKHPMAIWKCRNFQNKL